MNKLFWNSSKNGTYRVGRRKQKQAIWDAKQARKSARRAAKR